MADQGQEVDAFGLLFPVYFWTLISTWGKKMSHFKQWQKALSNQKSLSSLCKVYSIINIFDLFHNRCKNAATYFFFSLLVTADNVNIHSTANRLFLTYTAADIELTMVSIIPSKGSRGKVSFQDVHFVLFLFSPSHFCLNQIYDVTFDVLPAVLSRHLGDSFRLS